MSGNGAVAKVRVANLLEDQIADSLERRQQLDTTLDRAIGLFRRDRADDAIQVQNIEDLRKIIEREDDTLIRLQHQRKLLDQGRRLAEDPVKVSPEVAPE